MYLVIKLILTIILLHGYAVEPAITGVEIIDPHGNPGDMFGSAVAMTKDYVVVSSKYGGNHTGTVCLFNNDKGITHLKKLTVKGAKQYSAFGSSVAINKNYLVIGSRSSRKVYIYQTNTKTWDYTTIVARPGDDNQELGISFGVSVDINDKNEIVVGAPHYKNRKGSTCGAAYVFFYQRGKWRYRQRLTPLKSEGVGYKVSITNEYIILSANKAINGKPSIDFMGTIYIYKRRNDGYWQAQILLRSPSPTRNGLFGFSHAIDNNQLVIGAPNEDDNKGNVYVYKPTGRLWKRESELKVTDHPNRRLFGISVSIHDKTIIIGTATNTSHLFELSNGKWVEKDKLIVVNRKSVSTVKIFDNKVIIGCKSYVNGKMGVAYAFDV